MRALVGVGVAAMLAYLHPVHRLPQLVELVGGAQGLQADISQLHLFVSQLISQLHDRLSLTVSAFRNPGLGWGGGERLLFEPYAGTNYLNSLRSTHSVSSPKSNALVAYFPNHFCVPFFGLAPTTRSMGHRP